LSDNALSAKTLSDLGRIFSVVLERKLMFLSGLFCVTIVFSVCMTMLILKKLPFCSANFLLIINSMKLSPELEV